MRILKLALLLAVIPALVLAQPTISPTSRPPSSAVVGTKTNDNAASGILGEYISNTATAGSVSLTINQKTNISSVSLTAVDWDVCGNVIFQTDASTVVTQGAAWIDTQSATLTNTDLVGGAYTRFSQPSTTGPIIVTNAGCRRVSLSATTTVYIEAFLSFTTSTATAGGFIGARRAR